MSLLSYFRHVKSFSRVLPILRNSQYVNSVNIIKTNSQFRFLSAVAKSDKINVFATLDNNFRENQRVYKTDLELALNEIDSKDYIQSDYAQFLIKCCGHTIPDVLPNERINIANQIWQTYKNKSANLDVNFYNSLLEIFIENGIKVPYKEYLKTMNCESNELTYQLLLRSACEKGDLVQATEIVNVIKQVGYSANEPVFSSLIIGHLRSGDIANAKNILSTMKIALLNPTAITFTELLRGFAELNDEKHFRSYLSEASNSSGLSVTNLITILRSICSTENLHFLKMVKTAFPEIISSRNFEISLTNLCINLIYLEKPKVAYETYKCFIEPEVGFLTESDTYASPIISELVQLQTYPADILEILNDLVKSKRNTYAFFKALHFSLQNGNINLSIVLLKSLHTQGIELRNHYFWPVLISSAKINQSELFRVFQLMKHLGLKIDQETLETYSLQYIKNMDSEVIIQKLKELGLTVKDVLTPIAVVLIRQNKLREVVQLCEKYKIKLNGDSIIKPLSLTFLNTYDVKNTIGILRNVDDQKYLGKYNGQLLVYLFNKPKIDYSQILKLLEVLQKNKMRISSYSLDKIEYLSRKINNPDLKSDILKISNSIVDYSNINDQLSNIPHPRDMSLDQLECHLIELNNKKMETRGILRKLIQMYCRLGNEKRVNELLNEFNDSNYKLSTGMKAGLMDLYIKNKNLELTKKFYEDIIKSDPSFVVDEFKVIDLATLLVNDGKFDEALLLIKNEAGKRKILGGKTLEKNCWNLLNSVVTNGDENQTKLFFDSLINLGYCKPTNIILGPLIRIHLQSDNLKAAVDQYLNCCEKYKCTPLQQELLVKLVSNEDCKELTEKVLESIGKIHGLKNAKVALTVALASANKVEELRTFIKDLKEDLPPNLLELHCNQWIKESNTVPLENLFKIKELFSKTTIMMISSNLIRIYCSLNDWKNALRIWEELQEIDLPISDGIKNQIATLLENNRQQISFKI